MNAHRCNAGYDYRTTQANTFMLYDNLQRHLSMRECGKYCIFGINKTLSLARASFVSPVYVLYTCVYDTFSIDICLGTTSANLEFHCL